MNAKSEVGKIGEDLSCLFLVKQKYKFIERNFWKPLGELDIIAMSPDKTLVFVEVKTIRQCGNAANSPCNSAIQPEDNLTNAKLKKLQKIAYWYVGEHPELINGQKGWRMDLIAILLDKDRIKYLKHFENL